MFTTDTTPDRLTLGHKPVAETVIALAVTLVFGVLAVWFFADGNDAGVILLVFAVSGPVYWLFFVETREVVFDRAKGQVRISNRSPRGRAEAIHPLAGLARAEVHRATPSRESRVVDAELAAPPRGAFRAVLLYEDGTEHPLTDSFVGGKMAFDEVRAVNRWLEQG